MGNAIFSAFMGQYAVLACGYRTIIHGAGGDPIRGSSYSMSATTIYPDARLNPETLSGYSCFSVENVSGRLSCSEIMMNAVAGQRETKYYVDTRNGMRLVMQKTAEGRYSWNKIINGQQVVVRSLEKEDFKQLHSCWCLAFSDYKLPLNVTEGQLDVRLRQDGYYPHLSVGAFTGEQMIGFWLSGLRYVESSKMAYDAGTAMVAEWRNKGLSSLMASAVDDLMNEYEVDAYVLEVFCDNVPAIKVYKRQGFVPSRRMFAYRADPPVFPPRKRNSFRLERQALSDVASISAALLDYEPSWQNSWKAIRAVQSSTVCCVVRNDEKVVGFAVFQPILRRIAQIGVMRMSHDAELSVVRLMLEEFYDVLHRDGYIEIVNIPSAEHRITQLLSLFGFKSLASLYEMKKVMK